LLARSKSSKTLSRDSAAGLINTSSVFHKAESILIPEAQVGGSPQAGHACDAVEPDNLAFKNAGYVTFHGFSGNTYGGVLYYCGFRLTDLARKEGVKKYGARGSTTKYGGYPTRDAN
jgi:hypothetical protein